MEGAEKVCVESLHVLSRKAVLCGIIPGMERIATDISSFEDMRWDGGVYVDKTDFLWRLAAENVGRQFFLSRPRRFGKSLMLLTSRSSRSCEHETG